jgi:hypothetical protein
VHDSEAVSTGFGVESENYGELEQKLVPEAGPTDEEYGGYSFVISYEEVGKHVKPI